MNRGKKNKVNFLLMAIVLFSVPLPAKAEIVCNSFQVVSKLVGTSLELSLKTDLPDKTDLMVSVSRSYFEKGNSTEYAENYLSEGSTVGKRKARQTVSVDSEQWEMALMKKQEERSRVGIGINIATISNKINVSMVVPINQSDPQFGKGNSNLVGKAVSTTGLRIVQDEVAINLPLKSHRLETTAYPRLDPLDLEVGRVYVVAKQTPLMPALSPSDPLSALKAMRYIPTGSTFKILDSARKNGNRWYKVVTLDSHNSPLGGGWINSSALLGQKLQIP